MAKRNTGIVAPVLLVFILSLLFYACQDEKQPSPVEPRIEKYGLQGKVVDTSGNVINDVNIRYLFFLDYIPGYSIAPAKSFSPVRLSKVSSGGNYPFMLYQNLPNPVQNDVFFRFSIPSEGEVEFKITDRLGSNLIYKYSENLPGGLYQIGIRNFSDSLKLKNGVYRFSLDFNSKTGGSFHDSKKLIVIGLNGPANAKSDLIGNYFLDYAELTTRDTIVFKQNESESREIILGSKMYLRFEKQGYIPVVVEALVIDGMLMNRDVIMYKGY